MKRLFLAAGVAALAIAAPATAERGGKGGGNKGQAAKVERGGGGQSAKAARVDRGGEARLAAMQSQGRGKPERAQSRGNAKDSPARVDKRGNRNDNRARAEKLGGVGQQKVRQNRIEREDRRAVAQLRDRDDRKERLVLRNGDRDLVRVSDIREDRFGRVFETQHGLPPGLVGRCPPGLQTKTPACVPPGQVKHLLGQRLPAVYSDGVLPMALRDLYRDTDDYYYRYGDGYLYRVDRDRDLISSILPLFGAGLGIGQPFPSAYSSQYVPSYYRSFYPETQDDYYRYANGYVYEIDRDTGLIEDIIPLAGHGYGVGQMLPASYSYYNVPYQYRSLYRDEDDYFYRYAPGAIYQVDRDTQLITAIASLLTGGGLSVGQALPMGYNAYNVPLSYRDRYYDTQDAWYRYNNGYIYQVDPTTRLITAIVSAIV